LITKRLYVCPSGGTGTMNGVSTGSNFSPASHQYDTWLVVVAKAALVIDITIATTASITGILRIRSLLLRGAFPTHSSRVTTPKPILFSICGLLVHDADLLALAVANHLDATDSPVLSLVQANLLVCISGAVVENRGGFHRFISSAIRQASMKSSGLLTSDSWYPNRRHRWSMYAAG
jgi:hypothetical protein